MVDTHKYTSLYMSCIFIKKTHHNFSEEFGPAKHAKLLQCCIDFISADA